MVCYVRAAASSSTSLSGALRGLHSEFRPYPAIVRCHAATCLAPPNMQLQCNTLPMHIAPNAFATYVLSFSPGASGSTQHHDPNSYVCSCTLLTSYTTCADLALRVGKLELSAPIKLTPRTTQNTYGAMFLIIDKSPTAVGPFRACWDGVCGAQKYVVFVGGVATSIMPLALASNVLALKQLLCAPSSSPDAIGKCGSEYASSRGAATFDRLVSITKCMCL